MIRRGVSYVVVLSTQPNPGKDHHADNRSPRPVYNAEYWGTPVPEITAKLWAEMKGRKPNEA